LKNNHSNKKNLLEPNNVPLAIIGIGCMFPQADTVGAFWTNIKDGVDSITEVPDTHWSLKDYYDQDSKAADKVYARLGGFLSPVEFNPMDYGILPNAIEAIDTSQLLGLLVVDQALKDAGYKNREVFDREKVSVILGVTGTLELVIPLGARLGYPKWKEALQAAGVEPEIAEDVTQRISDSYVPWQENSFPGLLGNVVAGRISKHFNFGGTNCVVDSACGSSLSALNLAALELATGRADMVVTGGIDTFNDIFMYTCFSKTPALSPSGHARPYDENSDGTTLGEGLGIVVLKRLVDAERDKDKIYAVIKGIGTSSDGSGSAIYEPDATGQKKALLRAYQHGGVTPDTIELIEGHGTGTKVGDAAEVNALHDVFGSAQKPWCALGSVKSQIGHTKAAAGAAGLIKAALALHHKTLPATIKVTNPLEVLSSETTPFYVNTESRPWIPKGDHPRRAGISAHGFGGSNFHCLLEEHQPNKATADWKGDVQAVPFSDTDRAGLINKLLNFPTTGSWTHLRLDSESQRRQFVETDPHRLVLVIKRNRTDRASQVKKALTMLEKYHEQPFWETTDGVYYASGSFKGKTAMLFPGQGAQYTGMLKGLAIQFPEFLSTLQEADDAFAANSGKSRGTLTDIIYPRPQFDQDSKEEADSILRATEVAQPALGAVNLAACRVLSSFGVSADSVAGHSYGELSALCSAEVFTTEQLHYLSRLRGELMTAGNGDRGSMLAVFAPLEQVEGFLAEESLDLVIANRNTPDQGVLSGATTEIEKATLLLDKKGIRSKRLTVSAAFHSPLVSDAAHPFAEKLRSLSLQSPGKKVFSNTTGLEYPDSIETIKELLAKQLISPVDFVSEIENMYRAGCRLFIEVGPGARLTGMVKAILGKRDHQAIALDSSNGTDSNIDDLARLLARLSALGKSVDWSLWDEGFAASRELAGKKKPGMAVSLCGANYYRKPEERPPVKSQVPGSIHSTNQPSPILKTTDKVSPKQAADTSIQTPNLQAAFRITQQSIQALQDLQHQTASLHQKFLEGQQKATQSLMKLADQQNLIHQGTVGHSQISDSEPIADTLVEVVNSALQNSESNDVKPLQVETNRTIEVKVAPLLLEIIAEKTGYPVEMLELDMALDSDLGIDSIKRVEILSALQEKLPMAPVISPEDLNVLKTLEQIIDYLSNGMSVDSKTGISQDSGRNEAYNISTILLEVIAEKTGYPLDILEPDMALDTDLGIDSIKRVEILSALQERLPDAPVIKPEVFGTLQTVSQIVDFLSSASDSDITEADQTSFQKTVSEDIIRQVLRTVSLPKNRPENGLSVVPGTEVWITDDGSELSDLICSQLSARQLIPRKISIADVNSLVLPEKLSGLVILTPLGGADDLFLRNSFKIAQKVEPALQKTSTCGGAFFAVVSRMNGQFGLGVTNQIVDPLSGGLAGLCKTAAMEWPVIHCKVLDLEKGMEIVPTAQSIVNEIFTMGPIEVGITSQGLLTLELMTEQIEEPVANLPVGVGDLVVISGGARGVTAEVAVALAASSKATLLLIGRSKVTDKEPEWLSSLTEEAEIKKGLIENSSIPLKPLDVESHYRRITSGREIRITLERIQKVGGIAIYRSIDLRDSQAFGAILDDIRDQYGPVKGLIHGAGVLADKRIKEKTEEQFEQVYSTKVGGLRTLLKFCPEDDLRFIALFSSSTARFGRIGQVDYAVANEVLNKIADQRAELHPDCRVLSFNWGPWDGGMVTPSLKKVFEKEGIEMINLKAGADILLRDISTRPGGPVELVILGRNTNSRGEKQSEPDHNIYIGKAFDLDLSVDQYPFLKSHVIDGKAVLPMAIIIEWLAHGAIHDNPGLKFQGFNDLRILRGVIIEPDQVHTLQVLTGKAMKSNGIYIIPVELSGIDCQGQKVAHARARIVLTHNLADKRPANTTLSLPEYPYQISEIYQSERLFHGEDFQGIRKMLGCSEEGISALANSAPMPSLWIEQPLRNSWFADPLVLDTSFQLLTLWSFEQYQAGSLPVFAGRYRQFQERFPETGVEIRARVKEQNSNRAHVDIDFIDPLTELQIARLENYECVIDASLKEKFQRNKLIGVA